MARALRREAVTKPDGRYLIYYSWPDNGASETRSGDEAASLHADAASPHADAASPHAETASPHAETRDV